MPFTDSTRRKLMKLSTQTNATSNILQWDIPKTGLLAAIYLDIKGTVAAVPGPIVGPSNLGYSVGIRRVRLFANSGIDLFNVSGPGYHWLLRDNLESYVDVVPASTARSAVAAGTYDASMVIPVALNQRDPLGLFMLQNEQTLVQLQVEVEVPANMATGGISGHTVSIQPLVEFFTVPADPKNWPALNLLHTVIEDSRAIAGAGDYEYRWPRGNTYLQVLHGSGFGVTPAVTWTNLRVKVNQSDTIVDTVPNLLDLEYTRTHGRARLVGTIPVDLIGSDALGTLGGPRDFMNSRLVTELLSLITFTGATTLYSIRRQFVEML